MRRLMALVFALGMAVTVVQAEETAASPAHDLKVEAKVGTGIEKLDPTGVADSFDVNSPALVGWCRVTGAQEPIEIQHVWKYKGETISTTKLQIKSARYRTYSRKGVAGRVGPWTFEVQDAQGHSLASVNFEVTARSEGKPAGQ